MSIRETQAKSILRKHRKLDTWFLSRYGMNLYRGCTHNCVYCDGRAEKYRVEGTFGKDIEVKTNSSEILGKEIDPARKRKPLDSGFFLIGGGVGDSYQPAEKTYRNTRQALNLMFRYGYPIHILTKSLLVQEDTGLICDIHQKNRAVLSFSFSSTDMEKSHVLEPGIPSPVKRLNAISSFRNKGLLCGAFLMPVIPYMTDIPSVLRQSLKDIKDAGCNFVVFSSLTLKEGRQKEYFSTFLKSENPGLLPEYTHLYPDSEWGNPREEYITALHRLFADIAAEIGIPVRMPLALFPGLLKGNDLAVAILEHIDYLLRLKHNESPFRYASKAVSDQKFPLSENTELIKKIKGVGKNVEKVLKQIARTGTSDLYNSLGAEYNTPPLFPQEPESPSLFP